MSRSSGVLRRWNPRGWQHLHDPPVDRVRVVGLSGSGVGSLVRALRQCAAARGETFEIVRDDPAPVTLVVFDATAVIGRTEIGLVRDAATRSQEVVGALTGIDRVPGWQSVLEADLDLLRRYVPEVPEMPVTGVVGRCGDGAGLGVLCDILAAAVRATGDPRRSRVAVVDRTRLMIEEEMSRLRDRDDAADLRIRRAQLVTATTPGSPRPDLHAVRARLLHSLSVRMRETADAAFAEVDASGDPDLVDAVLAEHLGDMARALRQEQAPAAAASAWPEPTRSAPPDPGGRSLEDILTAVFGASAGAGLGRLVSVSFEGLPTWGPMLVAAACAVPTARWLLVVRRRIAHRDRLRRWIVDELAAVRNELEAWIRTSLHDEEVRLLAAATADRDRYVESLRGRIAEIDDAIARSDGERRARIAACERDLAALERMEPYGGRVRRSS